MTTQTATMDMTGAFGTSTAPVAGGTVRVLHHAARLVGHGSGAVGRWLRAGQLGDTGSVDLSRWAGARR